MLVFLAIGAAAFVYGFMQLLSSDEGWQQIQVSSGAGLSCGDDFVLLYDLGRSGAGVSAEKRGLTAVYTEAAVKAYQLFDNLGSYEDVHNVWYLNRHPNETVDVDPALYAALKQVQRSGDRSLYLGPVYEAYDGMFTCDGDWQAEEYDPRQNEPLGEYFARCAAFARDPASVAVELLEGGQVRLNVSEEYLAFAREEEIGSFIDFNWMKNAFIADYLAQALAEKGYTHGALSSYDGFVRNLCAGEETFQFNIYDRGIPAAALTYTGPMSIVYLRSYPMSAEDAQRFYAYENGQIRSAYVDPADGLCRTAWDDLAVCGPEESCAGLLLALSPLYVAERPDTGALTALAERGICSIRCEDGKVLCTDPDLTLTPAEGYETAYGE